MYAVIDISGSCPRQYSLTRSPDGKVLGYRKRWRDNRLLVNNHPEMKLVDPGQGLMSFESDDVTRAFVLDNNEPGASEPFLIRDDEQFDE